MNGDVVLIREGEQVWDAERQAYLRTVVEPGGETMRVLSRELFETEDARIGEVLRLSGYTSDWGLLMELLVELGGTYAQMVEEDGGLKQPHPSCGLRYGSTFGFSPGLPVVGQINAPNLRVRSEPGLDGEILVELAKAPR